MAAQNDFDSDRLIVVDHPLVQHKLHILRDKETSTKDFRELVTELAIIPILRAGLGMVDGILTLVPTARVGHVGMYRDPETHEPVQYYCKFPADVENRTCLVVDPMLATGGSLTACIKFLRDAGVKDIRCLTLVSCPEGVKTVLDFDPDVLLYTCVVDRQLNENAYILPGLGDAGDRIYGTK